MDVLVADDSKLVREHLLSRLKGLPYIKQRLEAADAREAYGLTTEYHPDVIVVDIHMPGDGLELAGKLVNLPDRPVIIMLTNYAHDQYRKRSAQIGVDFFFDKTTEFDEALDVLEELAIAFGGAFEEEEGNGDL